MADVFIKYDNRLQKKGSVKIEAFQSSYDVNERKALGLIGGLLARQITANLSGPAHSKGKTSNPYPGVVSSTLKGSSGWKYVGQHAVMAGVGGSAKKYARAQEFGATISLGARTSIKTRITRKATNITIPPRPYVAPAFNKHRENIKDIFMGKVVKAPISRNPSSIRVS